jgi:hypothetical protein
MVELSLSSADVEAPAPPSPRAEAAKELQASPSTPARSGGLFSCCLRVVAAPPGSPQALRASGSNAGAFASNCLAIDPVSFLRVKGRGAQALVQGLSSTVADQQAQAAGCAALRRLARHAVGREAVGNAGGVAALLKAVEAHPGCARVLQEAWAAVAALALSGELEASLVRAGALEAAVRSLATLADHPRVVEATACALRNLCGSRDSQAAALAAGVLPALVAALRAHVPREACLVALLGALRNACAHAKAKAPAAQAGAIDVTLAALRAWPASAEVQAHGLGALWSLAGLPANKVRCAGAGALDDILKALREHPKAGQVQEAGLAALASLVWSNAAYKERARQAGAAALADAALEAFPEHQAVRAHASEVLSKLHSSIDPFGDSFMPNM